MFGYILKRLLVMIPTLFGITLVTFAMINFAPGDPVETSMGGEAGAKGGEGGASKDRIEDAKKAKRKLLGILREEHAALAWETPASVVGAAAPAPETSVRRAPPLRPAGALVRLDAWPRCFARRADDASVLYVGTDEKLVHAVDPATGAIRRTFAGHEAPVYAAAISADGATLVSGDGAGRVIVWSAADGRRLGEGAPLALPIRDLVFLGDGRRFAGACDDGVVRVYAVPDAKVLLELRDHTSFVAALAASADGARLWSGGYDRVMREWDASTGKLVRKIAGHQQSINDLALSADGRLLASACEDYVVRVFRTDDFDAAPALFKGHYKAVTAVALSPDAKTIYAGSNDESVRAWDVASGAAVAQSVDSTGKVRALAVSANGRTLWSASESWVKTPIWTRYVKWLGNLVTLDFDRSFIDGEPVWDKLKQALPVTIGLSLLDILLIYVISIPIGVIAAVKRGSTFDNVSSVVLFLLYSIPSFWLATILIMQFSSERAWNVLPSVGLHDVNQADMPYLTWLWDWATHLVLPVVVMVYAGFAGLSRYVRTSMLETISQDYVRTARAKGLSERVVVFKHALRNSMITIVTLVANLLPALIGGSVIVEYIFTINGMGRLGFDAILQRDYPVIMAITTFSALLTLVGILVSDLLYSVVDPRISHS